VTYPVFIICRDRLTCLVGLLDWLESVGHADEVYLMDNDSTWPPLLEFYETTRHTVLHSEVNAGHKVGWSSGWLKQYVRRRPFIVTDPDLLPVDECPDDAVAVMAETLAAVPNTRKVGFSLKIDDIPDHFPSKQGAIDWETRYWSDWDKDAGAWVAPIDTTFALYAPWALRRFGYTPSFRLPEPYTMRHLPWYLDPADLSEEDVYYMYRADKKVSNVARILTA